jgi:hypothetical protein
VGGEHRQQGARQGHDRVEVHRHDRVELRGVHLGEASGERDPGVVDQQCDVGMSRGDRLAGRHGGHGVGEIGDALGHPDAGGHRPGRGGDGGEAVRVAVEQDEVAAARGEPCGQRRADPARGAGDDGRPALEDVPAHRTPSLRSVEPIGRRHCAKAL